ncbi:AIPR family protein [Pseudoalteromonas sp. Of11M-6]|uniref:AIPR family protein n=1 Tax=Pseudoalteromonas sp. Of11M-6 TaxID=2917754 RepID=UPI001EF738F5|nr:AIPR family protein [Pseudoalteromonas sp. Of11M-6]MCG7555920.1 AIPR family protein [Pseudoalteromonas sp. Of11M-6]
MPNNDQILLSELLKQEADDFDEAFSESEFFEFYSANQILKGYELSYEEIKAGIAGESHDGGADSIFVFVNGDLIKEDSDVKEKYKKNPDIELVIIQSKKENGFGEDALLKLSRLCKNLLDLEFNPNDFIGRYNETVLSIFELFKKTYVSLVTRRPSLKVSFYYVSMGSNVHENVNRQAGDLVTDVKGMLPNSGVSVDFIGAHELVTLSQERPNEAFRLATTEAPLSTSEKVFIALTNIKDYYTFISDESGKLLRYIFESNVRDYQGKTNVNKEIQVTLESENNEEFWWLNNGVTILGSDATTPGGKELIIHNPQIVNGLQTSSEIHRFFTNNPDRIELEKRAVLIRVIVPEDEETRDRIIRATNSQTPIPKSSLRATDNVHRSIEDYFRPRGMYYDRRKNFYKNEGKKPKEIVSLPFLSQCLMSTLLQRPDSARARPSTLLENDESYDKLFHINNALSTYFVVALWGRNIELRLKELKKYETAEISDIKFYVLYYICCAKVRSLYPSNIKVNGLENSNINNSEIDSASEICYEIFKELGGTNTVAKGTSYLERVKEKLKQEYDF